MKTKNSYDTDVQEVELFSFFGIRGDQNEKSPTQKPLKKSKTDPAIENKEEVVNKIINFLKTA